MSPQSTCASFDNSMDTQEMWSPASGAAAGFFDTQHHPALAESTGRGGSHAVPQAHLDWQYHQNLQQPGNTLAQPPASSAWMPQSHASTTNLSWSSQLSPSLSLSGAPPSGATHLREGGLTPDAHSSATRVSPFASAGSSIGSTSPDLRLKSPRLKVECTKSPTDSSPGNSESNATNTSKERRKKPRRKAHNAIEKRYRVKLNEKIAELRDSIPSLRSGSGLVTDGGHEYESPAEVTAPKINKAHILEKATEYVKELEASNRHLQEELYRERTRSGQTQIITGQHTQAMDPRGQQLGLVPMGAPASNGSARQPWSYTYAQVVPNGATALPQPSACRR